VYVVDMISYISTEFHWISLILPRFTLKSLIRGQCTLSFLSVKNFPFLFILMNVIGGRGNTESDEMKVSNKIFVLRISKEKIIFFHVERSLLCFSSVNFLLLYFCFTDHFLKFIALFYFLFHRLYFCCSFYSKKSWFIWHVILKIFKKEKIISTLIIEYLKSYSVLNN
jgi:hypothetical protein